ncbi:hypothetical protein HanRHA438_Chr02g0056371 [Helianthus annuus]|nr:hypothetical protein HanRHA438_Chr02g0056371 [Helianthus annuus]
MYRKITKFGVVSVFGCASANIHANDSPIVEMRTAKTASKFLTP